ncbi:MAG: DUF835 domain-containing protein [Candidatus Altiarchaeales archaeon]|nr:DUF835 domain-containing protein [Candidatus Altiarchaeales archaeon]MBD3415955.1 DUF835 domain-containing protein [Candidatus Altiarchaeales archaeon]
MASDLMSMGGLEFSLNAITVLVSFAAVVYWVKFFRRIALSGRQGIGWIWIFASVLMVLLLNLSAIVMFTSESVVLVGSGDTFVVEVTKMELMNTLARTIIAVSVTFGAYLLYESMGSADGMKYMFKPVQSLAEARSKAEQKFSLEPGQTYLVLSGPNVTDDAGVEWDMFVDMVTHGTYGFAITRTYPPALRERYGVVKTPILWLTKDKAFKDCIHPTSLIDLSHMVKDFISHDGKTVVLLDGLVYLISHNDFNDVLKIIQGLNDVVVQFDSRIIMPIDPEALTERQFHMLKTEAKLWVP